MKYFHPKGDELMPTAFPLKAKTWYLVSLGFGDPR